MNKHNHSSLPLRPLIETDGYRAYTTFRDIPSGNTDDPYAGFNVCHYTGDDPGHVAECRARLAETFGCDVRHLIIPCQTHSTTILTVTDTIPSAGQLESVDGVVTTRRDIIIGVNTADCVPLIMIDDTHGVMAAIHAGWRGASGGIAAEAVKAMVSLGASPGLIEAAMGPSICQDCFEVGPEVASQFPPSCVRTEGFAKPHVSLQGYIIEVLIGLGVEERNIRPFDKEFCTRCHPSLYFSARALGTASGRVFTFVTALTKDRQH